MDFENFRVVKKLVPCGACIRTQHFSDLQQTFGKVCLTHETLPEGLVQKLILQECPNPFLVLALMEHTYCVPGTSVVRVTLCAEAGTSTGESRLADNIIAAHRT